MRIMHVRINNFGLGQLILGDGDVYLGEIDDAVMLVT